jgi:hypothetical protein
MTKEALSLEQTLRLALKALELVSIEFVCNGAHHAKKDRHEWLDPCPIVGRYKDAISAIKAALANEALERKAENARELGLDYEPLEAKDEPVAWISHNAGLYHFKPDESLEPSPLYLAPPQRKPLSGDEIVLIIADCASSHQHLDIHLARAIEAAHGIKGGA